VTRSWNPFILLGTPLAGLALTLLQPLLPGGYAVLDLMVLILITVLFSVWAFSLMARGTVE
jgi:hypothetical protein